MRFDVAQTSCGGQGFCSNVAKAELHLLSYGTQGYGVASLTEGVAVPLMHVQCTP